MYSILLLGLPLELLQLIAFGFGVIIGSFLNVYIYRFHTGKSLSGHSHCLSCGAKLRWFELFPLVSYLALRGRCRTCGCSVTTRYFFVELATGLLFAGTLFVTGDLIKVLLLWAMLSILVVITVYDLNHFIIPDELTISLLVLAGVFVGYRYLLIPDVTHLAYGIIASLAGSLFFFILWFISKGAWIGFGDVKLAVPLGLVLGYGAVFSFVVVSFWIGAATSLMLIGYQKAKLRLQRGKGDLHLSQEALTMKSAVPFAPFLVASFVTILFTRLDVLQLFHFMQ
tara:strand:- start:3743 stop:4591 length:849 start_codon:yes stop_codon:yes gene_type:complete